MKHKPSVTTVLVTLFLMSQLIGLGLLAMELSVEVDEEGQVKVVYEDTAIGARPQTTGGESFLYLVIGIGIGTAVLLLLARYNLQIIWKGWFFLAVWITLTIALGALATTAVAAGAALILAAWKIFRPNTYVHNLTEVLVYSGICILLVPIFNLLWASLLLLAIAVYDAYAVWKSKHMVSLAKFQTESKMFAGLHIDYAPGKQAPKAPSPIRRKDKQAKAQSKSAVLGGGDMTFPLLFTGTVLNWLLLKGIQPINAFWLSTIVVATSTASLTFLFIIAKKDRFYPAMPFISAGCFVGLGIVWLLV